jgi:exosortase A
MRARDMAWGRMDSMGGAGEPARGVSNAHLLAPAAVGIVLLGALALHVPTVRSMMSVWANSSTFTHGFLVLPACVWFIWTRRQALVQAAPAPFWPALLVTAAAGLAWTLGELTASLSIAHFALVTIAISVVVAVFGLAWARELAFPQALLLFAVPFGEAFVPVLMDWTADFTVVALKLSGVPVLREGNDFTIPSGRWSVVEACSGARYLLASFVAGTLYAWVMYRSPGRRAVFMVVSILAPIVANWLRAYMIVMLGHLSDNALAAGVDHLIYGWVFFGFVIFLLFAAGARWREDPEPVAAAPVAVARDLNLRRLAPVLCAAGALVVAWPVLAAWLVASGDKRPLAPEAARAQAGWVVAPGPAAWQPRLEGPQVVLVNSFEKGGSRVDLVAGLYRDQRQGAELVNSQNQLAGETNGWRQVTREVRAVVLAGRERVVRSAVMRGAAGQYVLVWHWYWLHPVWSASDMHAKVDLALDRLLLRSDTSAWMAAATSFDPERPLQAEAVLRGFLSDMAGSIDSALTLTAQR